ncbi:MAG: hypothetical protein SO393_08290 [Eubacterium sp.]|nr:hypothetical protein [Eubacterium sp.]
MSFDKSKICSDCFEKYGRSFEIDYSDGKKGKGYAIIQQVWRRLKSKFEPVSSQLGMAYTDYYLYYGPAELDITRLKRDDMLTFDGVRYYFVRAERVAVGDTTQYYAGVLKQVYEEDSNVFG